MSKEYSMIVVKSTTAKVWVHRIECWSAFYFWDPFILSSPEASTNIVIFLCIVACIVRESTL